MKFVYTRSKFASLIFDTQLQRHLLSGLIVYPDVVYISAVGCEGWIDGWM